MTAESKMNEKDKEINSKIKELQGWQNEKRKLWIASVIVMMIASYFSILMVQTLLQFTIAAFAIVMLNVLHTHFQKGLNVEISRVMGELHDLGITTERLNDYSE